jgi:hypothetical protein
MVDWHHWGRCGCWSSKNNRHARLCRGRSRTCNKCIFNGSYGGTVQLAGLPMQTCWVRARPINASVYRRVQSLRVRAAVRQATFAHRCYCLAWWRREYSQWLLYGCHSLRESYRVILFVDNSCRLTCRRCQVWQHQGQRESAQSRCRETSE